MKELIEELKEALGPVFEVVKNEEDGLEHVFIRKDFQHSYTLGQRPLTHPAELHDLDSVVAWAKEMEALVSKPGWVFWGQANNKYGLTIIPDTSFKPKVAPASYGFKPGIEAAAWYFPAFSLRVSQRDFRMLIEKSVDLITSADKWLEVALKLRLIRTVEQESIQEDLLNHSFAYTTRTEAGSVSVPKKLALDFPIFEGADTVHHIELDVDLEWSSKAGGKPIFVLECVQAERIIAQAVAAEMDGLKEQLDGWRFFNGIYSVSTLKTASDKNRGGDDIPF